LDYFKIETSDVMVMDSLKTSHPINVEVKDPSEIATLFDLISYEKVIIFFKQFIIS
jgi:aminopeptidase N